MKCLCKVYGTNLYDLKRSKDAFSTNTLCNLLFTYKQQKRQCYVCALIRYREMLHEAKIRSPIFPSRDARNGEIAR